MTKDLLGDLIEAAMQAHSVKQYHQRNYVFEMSPSFLEWLRLQMKTKSQYGLENGATIISFYGIIIEESKILPPGWAAIVDRDEEKAERWFHLEN